MNEKDLVEEAFNQIYPEKEFNYNSSTIYSKRFSRFNANIKLSGRIIALRLSESWKGVDKDIQIGLAHSLLNKLFNTKLRTIHMEFYDNFIKNTPLIEEDKVTDRRLLDTFRSINERFFFNTLDIPNLRWGSRSLVRLGSYNFNTDTITISSLLEGRDERLVSYVMYHEMLHIKHKYSSSPKRHTYHGKVFKKEERLFPGYKELEKELERVIIEERGKDKRYTKRRKICFRNLFQ